MSLDWDVSKIANQNEVCWFTAEQDVPMRNIVKGQRYLKDRTRNIIFTTMAVGLGEITTNNWQEFYFRQLLWSSWHNEEPIPAADIKAHIGLVTNVFPNETRAKWLKRMTDNWYRDLTYALRRKEKEALEAAENARCVREYDDTRLKMTE